MDSVTHHYREAALSSPIPPASSHPAFSPTPSDLLARLNFLFPLPPSSAQNGDGDSQPTAPRIQTHLLHLAQLGWIGPHVDNKESMGDVLVGVCLGGERVLRLERAGLEGEEKTADGRVDVLLESGTVYVQRSVQSEVVCPSPQPQIADTPVVLNQWRGPQ
jgi:alkylated DNA repair protein alkB family protein 7